MGEDVLVLVQVVLDSLFLIGVTANILSFEIFNQLLFKVYNEKTENIKHITMGILTIIFVITSVYLFGFAGEVESTEELINHLEVVNNRSGILGMSLLLVVLGRFLCGIKVKSIYKRNFSKSFLTEIIVSSLIANLLLNNIIVKMFI